MYIILHSGLVEELAKALARDDPQGVAGDGHEALRALLGGELEDVLHIFMPTIIYIYIYIHRERLIIYCFPYYSIHVIIIICWKMYYIYSCRGGVLELLVAHGRAVVLPLEVVAQPRLAAERQHRRQALRRAG